jgi:uncharacterized protein YqjF (DUF2071 family)
MLVDGRGSDLPSVVATAVSDNPPVTTFGFLEAAARQARAVDDVARRPWPLSEQPWAQAQTREDVLFTSWRVGLDELARLVPPDVPLDTHAGEGWVSIVPFRLTNLRLRGLPPIPSVSFAQLDSRTYVAVDDRPGIWICSLDASSRLLAEAAKRVHRLPAYHARASVEASDDPDSPASGSTRGSVEVTRDELSFAARFRVAGEPFTPVAGSLEHFLTERYCIYTADGGRLYRAELHHSPWLLRPAEATVDRASISPVELEPEPHALFSAAQDVLVWPLEEL